MKQYDKIILNELLDKYERSILSKKGSTRDIKVYIKSNHEILEDYWADDSYLYKNIIESHLENLVKSNYIHLRYSKNHEIDYIDLNIESVKTIYKYLSRENLESKRLETIRFIKSYQTSSIIINDFKKLLLNKLENHQSVKIYFDELDELKLYLKAIEAMSLNEEDTLKRNFSKKIFNDSKLFEKIEKKVIKIIKDFSEEDFKEDEEVLSYYHIMKTPTFAYVKGNLEIRVNHQSINLSQYGHELALSSNAMHDLEINSISVKKVITIENLTTFIAFNDPEFFVVYLGGFHNNVKRNFLNKLYAFNNNIEFYHFGDIDAGGILIFEDLKNKTNIEFKAYMMDIKTLELHKEYWIDLTSNDKARLKKLSNGQFRELIDFMLKNNCKLEQEAIKLMMSV